MLLLLFKIFLTIIEIVNLIVQVNTRLFHMVRDMFIAPKRKSVAKQIVVITGGAKGLGRELSLQFASLGAVVVIIDIDELAASDVVNVIRYTGQRAHFVRADVSNYDQAERAFNEIKRLGPIDILINNAGILNGLPLTELPVDAIEKTIQINLLAHFWTIKCVLPKMFQLKRGHIVSIASNFGLLGRGCFTDYTAAKFGIVGYMESLEDELRYFHKEYIKLTTICPAAIETGLSKTVETRFPRLFPIMQPDYAAEQIIDAILKEKKFITIPTGYNILYIILLRLPRCIRHLIIDYIGSTAQPNRNRE